MTATFVPGFESGDIRVKDGTSIHYQHHKNADSDVCVVLAHSLAMDHRFWSKVAPGLVGKASVLCVDVRGHGQSGKPQGPYSIELFAQDIREVVDALGYKKVVIGGASMGGCISLQFTIDNPDVTVASALIDTTSWYGPEAPANWSKRAEKARTDGFASMVQFQTTRWFGDEFRAAEANQALIQECIEIFEANDVAAYGETCLAMGAFNAQSKLDQIKTPTAIVVGEEDYAAPVEMAQFMHNAIPGSSLKIIPGARHLTPLETPEIIIEVLEHLLATTK